MPLTTEEQVDHDDWQAFRRLDRMADHWWWRPGWTPDRHYLTWFLVYDNQALRNYVSRFQSALADLDYLDPVPLDGLHTTIQGIAFADQLTQDQVDAIAARARARGRATDFAPFEMTVGPINAYTGGTFLRARPWAPLVELRARTAGAIADVLGPDAVPDDPSRFKPHISVTYCHANPPTEELAARLVQLRTVPTIRIPVVGIDLIEQRREGRTYRWDIRHHVPLAGRG